MRRLCLLIVGMGLTLSAHAGEDLLSLYERAVLSSPELLSSQYTVDVLRAQEDRSYAALLPQVSISGNYSYNYFHSKGTSIFNPEVSTTYPGVRASINLQQPIFDLQAYLLMKSQEAKTTQSEEDLLSAHQKLISDLIDRYIDALEAADKSEITAAELRSTEQQLARTQAMQARQMAMVTDLYELQARTETLRTQLIDNDNNARIALEKLRELTGDAVTSLQPVRLDIAQPPPDGSIDNWSQQAGQLNPELRALKMAVESARQTINAYRAGYLPRIELQLSETYSDTAYNNRQSPPFDIATAGVQATVPIYDGGGTGAKIDEATARKKIAESQLEQKLREFEKLTRAAYLDMQTSPSRSLATDRQLAASEKSRDAMKKGHELGVVTIVDLLGAEKQLSEAKLQQRQARYRYFKARSSLYFQTGKLIAPELTKFNEWLVLRDKKIANKK
ncbi:alkaline protease secretion protein AprF [Methylosoma difficile]